MSAYDRWKQTDTLGEREAREADDIEARVDAETLRIMDDEDLQQLVIDTPHETQVVAMLNRIIRWCDDRVSFPGAVVTLTPDFSAKLATHIRAAARLQATTNVERGYDLDRGLKGKAA